MWPLIHMVINLRVRRGEVNIVNWWATISFLRGSLSVSSTQAGAGATRGRMFYCATFFLSVQRSEYMQTTNIVQNVSFRDQTLAVFGGCLVRISHDTQAIRAKIFCSFFFSPSRKIPGYYPTGENRLLPYQFQFIILRYSSYHSSLYYSASWNNQQSTQTTVNKNNLFMVNGMFISFSE
jgi:hypothetical protein